MNETKQNKTKQIAGKGKKSFCFLPTPERQRNYPEGINYMGRGKGEKETSGEFLCLGVVRGPATNNRKNLLISGINRKKTSLGNATTKLICRNNLIIELLMSRFRCQVPKHFPTRLLVVERRRNWSCVERYSPLLLANLTTRAWGHHRKERKDGGIKIWIWKFVCFLRWLVFPTFSMGFM